jgi:hypothetical protein
VVRVQPRADEELVVERIVIEEDREVFLPSLFAPEDDAPPRTVLSTAAFDERLRAGCDSCRPLLIFDQFEELVTLFEDAGERELQQRIAESLVALVRDEVLPVKVLFAFREDYLARVKQLLGAVPELVDQALRLSPPHAAELTTIIRGPFERYPGQFEPELTSELAERLRERLAQRFGTGEVSLSEVQTVCLRLWQSADPAALLDEKGVQGLLEDYLGEELEAFPPDLKYPAVALLGQMVTAQGTRNVISAESLVERVREEDRGVRRSSSSGRSGGSRASRSSSAASAAATSTCTRSRASSSSPGSAAAGKSSSAARIAGVCGAGCSCWARPPGPS